MIIDHTSSPVLCQMSVISLVRSEPVCQGHAVTFGRADTQIQNEYASQKIRKKLPIHYQRAVANNRYCNREAKQSFFNSPIRMLEVGVAFTYSMDLEAA